MTKQIAAERIDRLAVLAREAASEGEYELAREYVRLARRVAERHRLSLPLPFARAICDGCDAYMRPGRNARVRVQRGRVIYTCDCGEISRYPYQG